jgi:FMN-dependent NADH-azoreductase
MLTVLVITSRALGTASVSNQLVQGAIGRLRLQDPNLRVIARDLGGKPISHLTVESATALRGAEPGSAEQTAARALSDELIAEVKAADTLVIGAPMYNLGIASTKAGRCFG